MNIYEEILANIDADKRSWCSEDWYLTDANGKPVSRCLVEHVDLAVGTTYIKPNGKVFVSKSPKRWNRRERVLAKLASLLPKAEREHEQYEVPTFSKRDLESLAPGALSRRNLRKDHEFYRSDAQDDLVSWNDNGVTNRTKVRNLLKRAAKRFPED